MACGTIGLPQVPAMIELNIKASNSWEALHRSGLRVRMADRAHRARLILELSYVTTRAR